MWFTERLRFVWVVDPGSLTVSRRRVVPGELTGDRIPITEGLAEGERIVTAGVHFIREGDKVRLLEDPSSGRHR